MEIVEFIAIISILEWNDIIPLFVFTMYRVFQYSNSTVMRFWGHHGTTFFNRCGALSFGWAIWNWHWRKQGNLYVTLPETNIAHENPIFPGKYHQHGWFSMAMLVYRSVSWLHYGWFQSEYGSSHLSHKSDSLARCFLQVQGKLVMIFFEC